MIIAYSFIVLVSLSILFFLWSTFYSENFYLKLDENVYRFNIRYTSDAEDWCYIFKYKIYKNNVLYFKGHETSKKMIGNEYDLKGLLVKAQAELNRTKECNKLKQKIV